MSDKYPCCDYLAMRMNVIASVLAGLLFFTGWWMMIDVNANYSAVIDDNKVYYLPGLFGTAALILVNAIPTRIVANPYAYNTDTCCGPFMATMLLFLGFTTAFGSLIGSSYILVNDFLLQPHLHQWPGVGIFFQNLFIFSSTLLLKFGTRPAEF